MEKTNRVKIITRTVWLVSLVSFFTDISSEMLYPIMPIYLKTIGFSVVLIGVLEGVAEATAGLSKGYFGNLSDSTGKRMPFVQLGYIFSAFSKPMMGLITQSWWIFLARTTDRLGKGIRTSARDAILSDESTAENKGKVFGFHRAMDTFGAAIGPFAALVFLYYYPGQYQNLFLLAFIPALVGVAVTFLVKDKPILETGKQQKPGFFSYLKYWNVASADYKKLVAGLLIFALINSSDAFLLLFMKYKGLGDRDLILVYIFYNLVYAVSAYPMGILADKLGMRWSIFIGLLLFASVYFFILSANSIYFFAIVFFAYGIYAAATEGVAKAWITNLTDKKHTATAIGFFTSLSSICTMLASAIAGMLWQFSRPEMLFYISAGMAALLAIYFITVPIHNQYKPAQEQV